MTRSCASMIADLLNTERLEYRISYRRCSVNITTSSTVITAPVDNEGILKMVGAMARLSTANLSPPTTLQSSSRPQLGGGGGDDADSDLPPHPPLRHPRQPVLPPTAKATERRERINLLWFVTDVFWLNQVRSFQAGPPGGAGDKTGEHVCTQMYQYIPVCTSKGTKLHFKSPTADRRHVLCVGVGGDRTDAGPPQWSRVCPP